MYEVLNEKTVVSPRELAAVLGLTSRHVRRLNEDGIIEKTADGYNLSNTLRDYYTYKYKLRADTSEERELETRMKRANVELKTSKAEIAALEAEELGSKMHKAEDVEAVTNDMIETIRTALDALPARIAKKLVGIETAAEAARVIRIEVHKTMNELADYKYKG